MTEQAITLIGETPPARGRRRELVPSSTPDELIRLALQQNVDLEKLNGLLALKERWDAAQAKKAYDIAFAAFKAEGVRLLKNKTVTSGPLRGSRYAELFTIIDAITPALSKHGLSHSWKLTKDEKDWLEVTCYLRHADGHVETAAMGGPPDKREGDAKSAIQARASSKSYLERQTLKAVLGLAEAGDDNDGAGAPANADEDAELDRWREKAAEGEKALEAYYNANVPTEVFWKKHGPGLRKAAKQFDADARAALATEAAELESKSRGARPGGGR